MRQPSSALHAIPSPATLPYPTPVIVGNGDPIARPHGSIPLVSQHSSAFPLGSPHPYNLGRRLLLPPWRAWALLLRDLPMSGTTVPEWSTNHRSGHDAQDQDFELSVRRVLGVWDADPGDEAVAEVLQRRLSAA